MGPLPEERQEELLRIVNSRRYVSMRDLVRGSSSSESTVRRDLKELERRSLLRLSHGGVAASLPEVSRALSIRSKEHREAKQRIARAAAQLVQDNETIVLDAGSTVEEFVRALDPTLRLTCITCSIQIANVLCEKPHFDSILAGGSINTSDQAVIGPLTLETLARFRAAKFFLGSTGITEERGVTNFNLSLVDVRRRMYDISDQLVILADSSKFGMEGLASVVSIDEIDYLVTDDKIDEHHRLLFERHGVKVIMA